MNEAFRKGDRSSAKVAGIYTGLTVLTHFIATLMLAALAVVTWMYWLLWHKSRGANLCAILLVARLFSIIVLLSIMLIAWWLVPALVPFGLGHYLRIRGGPGIVGEILYLGLYLSPSLYAPTIQLPFILLGVS